MADFKWKGFLDMLQRVFIFAALGILFLYYLSFVGSMVFSAAGNDTAAFYSAPYLEQTTKQMIAKVEDKKGEHTKSITWFHEKNPEVLYALVQAGRKDFLKEAVVLDPYNSGYHRKFIESLLEEDRKTDIAKQIREFAAGIVAENDFNLLNAINFNSPLFLSYYSNNNRELLAVTTQMGFAKLFYFLGLSVYPSYPLVTKTLWTLAKNLAPDWSYFSVELASLEQFGLQDSIGVQKLIQECIANKFSKKFCEDVHIIGIPAIGSLQNKIRAIKTL